MKEGTGGDIFSILTPLVEELIKSTKMFLEARKFAKSVTVLAHRFDLLYLSGEIWHFCLKLGNSIYI